MNRNFRQVMARSSLDENSIAYKILLNKLNYNSTKYPLTNRQLFVHLIVNEASEISRYSAIYITVGRLKYLKRSVAYFLAPNKTRVVKEFKQLLIDLDMPFDLDCEWPSEDDWNFSIFWLKWVNSIHHFEEDQQC